MPEQVKIPGLVGGLAQVTARDLPQTRAALTKETEARVKKFVSPFLKVLDRARTVRLIAHGLFPTGPFVEGKQRWRSAQFSLTLTRRGPDAAGPERGQDSLCLAPPQRVLQGRFGPR